MEALAVALPKIITVFCIAFLFFWSAIIAGLALGLPPLVVIIITSLSYVSGVALVILLGERARKWFGNKTLLKKESFLGRIWDEFGVIGLGLSSPMLVGSQLGAAIGIALNARPQHLFLWMCVGGVGWSIILTTLVSLGVLGAQAVVQ